MHFFFCHIVHIDHSVIKAILHFLNSDAKDIVAVIPIDKKFLKLHLKIKANFFKDYYDEVKNIIVDNWTNIVCAEYFITQNINKYDSQLHAMIDKIRFHFKKFPCNYKRCADFPVNVPDYFDELSHIIIPKGKKNDPRFLLTAKAIILLFFVHGEFGKTTPHDPPSLFTKFDESINESP